jgi:hypothetical protein
MRDPPEGEVLLALAQAAAIDGERADLVARARAIAERELKAGAAPVEALRRALAARYGEGTTEVLLWRLVAEIRAGVGDAPGPERERLRALLWAITRWKLAESNPDYLVAATRAAR